MRPIRPERLLLLLALAAGPAFAVEAPPQPPEALGKALDPQSGELLYEEAYYCERADLECRVFYRRPDGELIAFKELDYQRSMKAPELRFVDYRSDKEIRKSGPVAEEVVVDAGFDNYVRQRWEDLADGDTIRFPFLLMNREEPVTMKAQRTECEEGKLCVRVSVDSWLANLFVQPIELTYDRETRQLLRYRGVSNLRTADGARQTVDIRYRYPGADSDDPLP